MFIDLVIFNDFSFLLFWDFPGTTESVFLLLMLLAICFYSLVLSCCCCFQSDLK